MPSGGHNRWNPTDHDIEQIETLCAMTLPMEHVAEVMGVSKDTIERHSKKNKKLAKAIKRGRARGAAKVYSAAFKMATSGECHQMTRFWLSCREKWVEQDKKDIEDAALRVFNMAYDRSKRFEKQQQQDEDQA